MWPNQLQVDQRRGNNLWIWNAKQTQTCYYAEQFYCMHVEEGHDEEREVCLTLDRVTNNISISSCMIRTFSYKYLLNHQSVIKISSTHCLLLHTTLNYECFYSESSFNLLMLDLCLHQCQGIPCWIPSPPQPEVKHNLLFNGWQITGPQDLKETIILNWRLTVRTNTL